MKNLAGNLFSKAGNFLKSDIYDDYVKPTTQSAIQNLKNPQANIEKMDQEILEILIEENRQLKAEF